MPKVIHLIDDSRVGGVLTGLRQLLEAQACLPGEHEAMQVASTNPFSVAKIEADAIVVHFAIAWRKLPFLLLLRLYNPSSKLILQEHHYCAEFLERQDTSSKRFQLLLRAASKIFDRMLAVSEPQAQWLRSLGARIDQVISPMANLSKLLELPVQPIAKRLRVGVSGRLCKEKGVDLVLQLLRHPLAGDFQFVIAGYGELEQQVNRAAALHENLEFVGRYDCPSDFLNSCDLVLIPSRQETFGLNCLEAKAAAKPVVVTGCSGLVGQAASCGVVVDATPDALAQGLLSLSNLPNLTKLGWYARSDAIKHNLKARALWCATLNEGAF